MLRSYLHGYTVPDDWQFKAAGLCFCWSSCGWRYAASIYTARRT